MRAPGALAMIAAAVSAVGACKFEGAGEPGDDGDDAPVFDAPWIPVDPDADPAAPDADPADPDATPPPVPDASTAFDPTACPDEYDIALPASPGSRYRFIAERGTFWGQHADCLDDHPGWTHLATLQSLDEVDQAAVFPPMFQYSYYGAVQRPDAPTADAGWTLFDGGVMPAQWGDDAPDDDEVGTPVEDGEQNIPILKESDASMQDVRGTGMHYAICECDGHDVDPAVAALIPAEP